MRSERFRTPTRRERELGLWVDRVGSGVDFRTATLPRLRQLGLYAAIGVVEASGAFFSPPTGELEVERGDAFMLYPEVPSNYSPHTKWESRWVVWGGPEADNLAGLGMFHPSSPLIRGGADTVAAAWAAIKPLIASDNVEAALQIKVIILDMLLALHRLQRAKDENPGRVMAEEAVCMVKENLGRALTVGELAEHFGMCEQNFRRLFKAATGSSPKEFILTAKMAKAKELLASRIPVKEVASLLGFREEFYFRRIFRRTTGHTPGSYQ
ncbi:MAG: helix-turn-helix transcriptional regulator [Victivallales bacterium]|nr:helix-turn-helix transcriptional regulator [Victivallales bacterium]